MTQSPAERHGCCPQCNEPLRKVVAQPVEIQMDGSSRAERGVTYLCANCKGVLSVQFDPYMAQRRDAGAHWFGERRGPAR
jgi:hypothetical protein